MLKLFSIKSGWLLPLWFSFGAAILAIEYFAGPSIAVSYFFLIPVSAAAYYNGRFWGLFLAVALPLSRFFFHFAWEDSSSWWVIALNTAIRILVLAAAAYLIDRVNRQTREIRVLRGILPICMYCKKIRKPDRQWESVEAYITEHSEAAFSHTFCPECGRKYYGDLLDSAAGEISHPAQPGAAAGARHRGHRAETPPTGLGGA